MKKEEDNLSKVANECGEKLRGLDSLIPPLPPVPKEQPWYENAVDQIDKAVRSLKPAPPEAFEPDFDIIAALAAISMASGFVAIGIAIGGLTR